MSKLTVARCREILGHVADSMTDAEIEAERDDLADLANILIDQFTEEMKRNPEKMKWLLHAHATGETE